MLKKSLQARNRLLQYHVLSGPTTKKTNIFVSNQVSLSFPLCKKPKVDYMLRTMLGSDRFYFKVIVHD